MPGQRRVCLLLRRGERFLPLSIRAVWHGQLFGHHLHPAGDLQWRRDLHAGQCLELRQLCLQRQRVPEQLQQRQRLRAGAGVQRGRGDVRHAVDGDLDPDLVELSGRGVGHPVVVMLQEAR